MGGRGSGGHNRKSSKRRRVEGNAGKRRIPKEPTLEFSGPLGRAPRHLRPTQKEVWYELARIVPVGVVEACDRWAFELLVCLMCKFRGGHAKAGEVTQIANLLARLGMTPADRGRVNPQAPAPSAAATKNPWDEFTPSTSTKPS